MNYLSPYSKNVQKVNLTKQSVQENANVGIIDDFMKHGGTIDGMKSILKEFNANLKAICVLAEGEDETDERIVKYYASLVKITNAYKERQKIKVTPGKYLLDENKA